MAGGTQAFHLLDHGLEHDHNGFLVVLPEHVSVRQHNDLLLQLILCLCQLGHFGLLTTDDFVLLD